MLKLVMWVLQAYKHVSRWDVKKLIKQRNLQDKNTSCISGICYLNFLTESMYIILFIYVHSSTFSWLKGYDLNKVQIPLVVWVYRSSSS